MAKKSFQRITIPENNIDQASLARHLSDPDPHPAYMKANAQLGVNYPKLFRSVEEFQKMPVTTSAGLFDPSLVYYIGGNEIADPVTGQTFAPFHPYSYDGTTTEVEGVQYPLWHDQIASFGDFNTAIRAAILAHSNDNDGNPNPIHPSLARKVHTHTASEISGILESVRDAVSEGYVSIFDKVTDFNEQPSNKKSVLYMGYDSDPYYCGHIYQYNPTEGQWEDKSPTPSASEPVDMESIAEAHNANEQGFNHDNLPYAAADEFNLLADRVTGMETIIGATAEKEIIYKVGSTYTDGNTYRQNDVLVKEFVTLAGALDEIKRQPPSDCEHRIMLASSETFELNVTRNSTLGGRYEMIGYCLSISGTQSSINIYSNGSSGSGSSYGLTGAEWILRCKKFTILSGVIFIGGSVCFYETNVSGPFSCKPTSGGANARLKFIKCSGVVSVNFSMSPDATSGTPCVDVRDSIMTFTSLDIKPAIRGNAGLPDYTSDDYGAYALFIADSIVHFKDGSVNISGGNHGIVLVSSKMDIYPTVFKITSATGILLKDSEMVISGKQSGMILSGTYKALRAVRSKFVQYNSNTSNVFTMSTTGATVKDAAADVDEHSFVELNKAKLATSNTGTAVKVSRMSDVLMNNCTITSNQVGVDVSDMSRASLKTCTIRSTTDPYSIDPNSLSFDGSRINVLNS